MGYYAKGIRRRRKRWKRRTG